MTEPQNYVFTLFGATGDLALKKLLPALFQAVRYNQGLEIGKIICASRTDHTLEEYLKIVKQAIKKSDAVDFDQSAWDKFAPMLMYLTLDVTDIDNFKALAKIVKAEKNAIPIYYLSLAPTLFHTAIAHISKSGLATSNARLVIEKPLGHDLKSAQELNKAMSDIFLEEQIYRIDHYLGKESVQNLMALRFGNRLLEPLWNRTHIQSVHITIAEQVGIDKRGQFYNQTGAMRDMVQNHLLQLLCFVAMEAPYALDPDAIRDEKLKVLKSLQQYSYDQALENSILGQYQAGVIADKKVNSFHCELDIPQDSTTETFFAAKMMINNARWSDVPFYVRTGKRMAEKRAEIVIYFRNVAHNLFGAPQNSHTMNKLVITLQPTDSIDLYIMAKPPGIQSNIQQNLKPVSLSLDFTHALNARRPTAYERLLTDVIRGDLSLFVRRDELEQAWRYMQPFLEVPKNNPEVIEKYMAGSLGPSPNTASKFIARSEKEPGTGNFK